MFHFSTFFNSLYISLYLLCTLFQSPPPLYLLYITTMCIRDRYDGVTGHLTFDEKNNPVKAVTVLKIVNGKYTFDSIVEAK